MTTSTLSPHRALRTLAFAIGGTIAAVVVVLGSLVAAAIALFVLIGGDRSEPRGGARQPARRSRRPRAVATVAFAGLGPALARLRR
jgi:hypothetical protein